MRKTLVAAFLIAAFAACMTVISCSEDRSPSPTAPETPVDPQTVPAPAPSMPEPEEEFVAPTVSDLSN